MLQLKIKKPHTQKNVWLFYEGPYEGLPQKNQLSSWFFLYVGGEGGIHEEPQQLTEDIDSTLAFSYKK